MTGKREGPLTRLFGGHRSSATLMACGVGLSCLAAFLVVGTFSRAQAAPQAVDVAQTYVVTVAKDVPALTPITPEYVTLKPFPAAYVPPGAALRIEDVVGKYATAPMVSNQLVLAGQVAAVRPPTGLSAVIPAGKVAFWMPMPDLLAQTGGLQTGDHVDVLLSVTLAGPGDKSKGVATQTTLQNVEVLFVGTPAAAEAAGAKPADPNNPVAVASANAPKLPEAPAKVMAFLLDPQDAVLAKYIKDSGGAIDLVLRGHDAHDPVTTEAVTADTLVNRFKFRVPEQWGVSR